MQTVPFADADGVSLYYELQGSGARLLCISGTGGDLRQQPRLDGPLAAASVDRWLMGESDLPSPITPGQLALR